MSVIRSSVGVGLTGADPAAGLASSPSVSSTLIVSAGSSADGDPIISTLVSRAASASDGAGASALSAAADGAASPVGLGGASLTANDGDLDDRARFRVFEGDAGGAAEGSVTTEAK